MPMKPILNPFAPEHRVLLGEVLRFVVVGITAVALQYGVYALMLLVVNAFIANTIGYGVGFALCHVVNYGLQQLILHTAIALGMAPTLAPLPMFAITVPLNFVLVRLVLKR